MQSFLNSSLVASLFSYFYIGCIAMAIIVSLSVPVERGIVYFNFLMIVFGFLLLSTMIGILYFLIQ